MNDHLLLKPGEHKPFGVQATGFMMPYKYGLFVGGYGSGKSEIMHLRALYDFFAYPSIDIAIYSPSFDLLTLNNLPRMVELLDETGYKYDLNKGTMTIVVSGYGRMIFRSLANPERIVGYEVGRSYIDELDTLPGDKAEVAWNKIIARNRQIVNVPTRIENETIELSTNLHAVMNKVTAYTTPEGFGSTYKKWAKSKNPDYGFVKIPTWENPYLPPDYVQSIRDSYPSQLAEAYLSGDWVNLTSGSVYPEFDRKKSKTDEELQEGERLIVGMDFNVTRSCAVIFVKRKDKICAVDEIYNAFDTRDMIQVLLDRYPTSEITVFPDKTGRARKSVNATETDIILLKNAGFQVKERGVNPPIKERVAACNNGFEKGYIKVNIEKCPNLVATLEQQTWDGNGMPKKDGTEDINDAFGYPVHALYKVKRQVTWAYNPRERQRVGSY